MRPASQGARAFVFAQARRNKNTQQSYECVTNIARQNFLLNLSLKLQPQELLIHLLRVRSVFTLLLLVHLDHTQRLPCLVGRNSVFWSKTAVMVRNSSHKYTQVQVQGHPKDPTVCFKCNSVSSRLFRCQHVRPFNFCIAKFPFLTNTQNHFKIDTNQWHITVKEEKYFRKQSASAIILVKMVVLSCGISLQQFGNMSRLRRFPEAGKSNHFVRLKLAQIAQF